MKGIDVSKYQGVIDFAKVKSDGIDFVMIRAGYGAGYIDQQFQRNITECNRLNIPCGVYWFSYALTPAMAAREAEYCLSAVAPYKLEFPIAFDYEYDSVSYAKRNNVNVTKSLASAIAKSFCGKIEAAKYYALNYTNKDFLSRYYEAMDYGIWLAAWNGGDEMPSGCQIWQYTSTGTVAGINGYVDMNITKIDFPAVIRRAGLNGLSETPWWDEALRWGIENGITDGSAPEDTATRAQVITMLKRYHDKFGG